MSAHRGFAGCEMSPKAGSNRTERFQSTPSLAPRWTGDAAGLPARGWAHVSGDSAPVHTPENRCVPDGTPKRPVEVENVNCLRLQRRSSNTTSTISRMAPTDPPPIQTRLPNSGINARCIMFSWLRRRVAAADFLFLAATMPKMAEEKFCHWQANCPVTPTRKGRGVGALCTGEDGTLHAAAQLFTETTQQYLNVLSR